MNAKPVFSTLIFVLAMLGGIRYGRFESVSVTAVQQPKLSEGQVPKLTVDNLEFKDLNRNGKLDIYEDWRKSPDVRARDLVGQMTLEEKAGAMMHGTARSRGAMGPAGVGGEYDLNQMRRAIKEESRPALTSSAASRIREYWSKRSGRGN